MRILTLLFCFMSFYGNSQTDTMVIHQRELPKELFIKGFLYTGKSSKGSVHLHYREPIPCLEGASFKLIRSKDSSEYSGTLKFKINREKYSEYSIGEYDEFIYTFKDGSVVYNEMREYFKSIDSVSSKIWVHQIEKFYHSKDHSGTKIDSSIMYQYSYKGQLTRHSKYYWKK